MIDWDSCVLRLNCNSLTTRVWLLAGADPRKLEGGAENWGSWGSWGLVPRTLCPGHALQITGSALEVTIYLYIEQKRAVKFISYYRVVMSLVHIHWHV